MNPAASLIAWFEAEGRDLPWRGTRDPYLVWISEIILQQTRVAQGWEYYLRFTRRFPDVHSLADATPDEVLKHWEGLGYYSRARNLHTTAKIISGELDGKFPETVEGLLKLKGIGPYTARAIASISFGVNVAVVDGNVFRVATRFLADSSPIDVPATRVKLQEQLDTWVKKVDAAAFNQAIMDLGALICLPQNPLCEKCPIARGCKAYKQGQPRLFPVKAKALKRSTKYFLFYLIIKENGKIFIQKRPDKGLWAGLYDIPNEEITAKQWKKPALLPGDELAGGFKHVFTHFDMQGKVILTSGMPGCEREGRFISPGEIPIFAFPKAVLNIFEKFLPPKSGKTRKNG